MELKDTVEKMTSADYRERFVAEYQQLKIRYEKLKSYCNKIEAALKTGDTEKEPPHDCPLSVLKKQQRAMGNYLHVLEVRAEIENISLE